MKKLGLLVSALLFTLTSTHSAHAKREADLSPKFICYALSEGLALIREESEPQTRQENNALVIASLDALDPSAGPEDAAKRIKKTSALIKNWPEKVATARVLRGQEDIARFQELVLYAQNAKVLKSNYNSLYDSYGLPRLGVIRNIFLRGLYQSLAVVAAGGVNTLVSLYGLSDLRTIYEVFLVPLFAVDGYLLWPSHSSFSRSLPNALKNETLAQEDLPAGAWSATYGKRHLSAESFAKQRNYEKISPLAFLNRGNSEKFDILVVNHMGKDGVPEMIVTFTYALTGDYETTPVPPKKRPGDPASATEF